MRSSSEDANAEGFFLELERVVKQLSIAEGGQPASELKQMLEDLKEADRRERREAPDLRTMR